MKKKAIILGLGLVICGLMLAQAQEKVVQPSTNSDETKIVSKDPGANTVDYDSKLYANKEEAMSAEQSTNPAKPTPDFDSKLVDERSSFNEKLRAPSRIEIPENDPKLNTGKDQNITVEKAPVIKLSKSGETSTDIDANSGLEKVKTEGAIFNYRNINGPESQVVPAPQGKIINYRDLKGPDDQPLEKQPVR